MSKEEFDQYKQVVFLVMNSMNFRKPPAIPITGKPLEVEQWFEKLYLLIEEKATQHLRVFCREKSISISEYYNDHEQPKIKATITEEVKSFIKGLKEYKYYIKVFPLEKTQGLAQITDK